ncbi:MAG: GIY-YIG nuclease family protein [Tabrizicola sp.]|jgi:putative endonuclease|nr:GIY-YIG nuclease family protein [Tabrizicola sp.]
MREYNFLVYLMASGRNGTLYCGVTNDLVRRVHEHREGRAECFTSKYGVSRLVWFEQHSDISEAILREKRIKNWNRAWKLALIEKENPEWRDLAVDLGLEPIPDVIPAKAGIQVSEPRFPEDAGSPPTRG